MVLTCELEENCRRLAARANKMGTLLPECESLAGSKSKLTDVKVLKNLRSVHELHRWWGENEIELDITRMKPVEAARRIWEFVQSRILGQ